LYVVKHGDEEAALPFTKPEELKAWLQTQPREIAIAIAAGAVLRVTPLVALALPFHKETPRHPTQLVGNAHSSPKIGREQQFALLACAAFGAAALAQVVAKYPTRAHQFRIVSRAEQLMEILMRADAASLGPAPQFVVECVFGMLRTFGGDFDSFASSAVRDAAYAAAGGANDLWTAASHDVAFIESDGSASELVSQRLWPNGAPSWAEDTWTQLRNNLPAEDKWWVWINWYDFVLRGGYFREEESLIYATVPESEWKKGPVAANAWIAARLEELGKKAPEESDLPPSSESQPISIPAPKPATIEPIIRAGKIALPDGAAEPELDAEAFNQALRALRSLIINLANDLDGEAEANIDKRAIGFLRRIGDGIPHDAPTQEQLFELAHQQETLEDYGKKVAAEWPDLLASRYLGVVRAFDGTMRQFAKWRSFKQNALKDRLTEEQRDNAPALARKFADALRDSANAEHVESAIPSVIENMAREIDREAEDAPPRERGAAGADTRAEDLITSIDNTIKRIGDVAMKGDVEKRAQAGFGAKVAKGFASQFEGEKLGENLGKWATSALLAAGASYVAAHPTELGNILAELMRQYPIIAQWLQPLIDHLRR
jgi:hypothetical protein